MSYPAPISYSMSPQGFHPIAGLDKKENIEIGTLPQSSQWEKIIKESSTRESKLILGASGTPPINLKQKLPLLEVERKDTSKGWGAMWAYFDAPIPEDSIYRKLLACIPVIGIRISVVDKRSLRDKIRHTTDAKRISKLTNIDNHYNVSSIVRELLSTALIVAAVAYGVLNVMIGLSLATACGVYIAFCLHAIYKNRQIINQLEQEKGSVSSVNYPVR